MMADLLSLPYVPFALALGFLLVLLLVELVALLVGGSVLGAPGEAPDLSPLETSFDLDPGAEPDVPQLLATSVALEETAAVPVEPGGLSGLLGLGHSPFMVWLAALALGFGVSGLAAQSLSASILGAPLPVLGAGAGALVVGLGFARRFARLFGRLLPGVETSATSIQFLGGLRGVVSQGIARSGSPAEVRVFDRHGNVHHLRCEPFVAGEEIPEGTEVLTLRERQGQGRWGLRIVRLS
jgi:hypothetical protein